MLPLEELSTSAVALVLAVEWGRLAERRGRALELRGAWAAAE